MSCKRKNEQISLEFLLQDVQIHLKLEWNDMSVICLRLKIQKLNSRMEIDMHCQVQSLKRIFSGFSSNSNFRNVLFEILECLSWMWLNNWFMASWEETSGLEASNYFHSTLDVSFYQPRQSLNLESKFLNSSLNFSMIKIQNQDILNHRWSQTVQTPASCLSAATHQ